MWQRVDSFGTSEAQHKCQRGGAAPVPGLSVLSLPSYLLAPIPAHVVTQFPSHKTMERDTDSVLSKAPPWPLPCPTPSCQHPPALWPLGSAVQPAAQTGHAKCPRMGTQPQLELVGNYAASPMVGVTLRHALYTASQRVPVELSSHSGN